MNNSLPLSPCPTRRASFRAAVARHLRRPAVEAVLATERRVAQQRLRWARTYSPGTTAPYAVGAFYSKPNGLTRGAQLQLEAMERAGVAALPVDASSSRRQKIRAPGGPVNLVLHSGAPECARLLNRLSFPRKTVYPIGYWAWELPDPPHDWKPCETLVSEIWTPSTFSAKSLAQLFEVPVRVVPHRVEPQPARRRDPEAKFTVLTMADSRSSFDRKNPAGAIAAFRAAFGDRRDVQLIVKLLGRPTEVGWFRDAVGKTSNVTFITDHLSLSGVHDLYRRADVLLSLHRAEGFGLPLLEAMAHGVPAVATGWSGNLDFMGDSDSILVPSRLVEVADAAGVYRYASRWADPDLDVAADALQRLETDQQLHAELSAAAHLRARSLTEFAAPSSLGYYQ